MDVREALGAQRLAGELRRHTHSYRPRVQDDGIAYVCLGRNGCGKVRDEERARSGKSSRRLGGDQERRIERVYGPRKVGEYGDAIDLIGRDFMWQSKATRGAPPYLGALLVWPVAERAYIVNPIAAMLALRQDRMPLLIRSWVRQGVTPTDVIWIRREDWERLHGSEDIAAPSLPYPFLAMTGAHFLDVHGRDEP